ncbi:hypothetical protein GGX14DRAFT_426021 [Mycena pura]|uniref:Extracellular membrane protein CFEM domain-containing protein n=1 Tax=Mycena pura TaxID=153505 RepID=A0AAD6YNI4_9AGAR|nr:hypothetical protein GGX14DRAFT_426021 [Mycena pura]
MFSKLICTAVIFVLAGRALASNFNVSVNKHLYLASQILAFDPTPVTSQCNANCSVLQTALSQCKPDDTACFCANSTATLLQACEECLFQKLVAANARADQRAGSNQVLAGWTANCAASNLTIVPIGLSPADLGASWDGPFVSVFPTALGWGVAVMGGLLGVSLIYLLCDM